MLFFNRVLKCLFWLGNVSNWKKLDFSLPEKNKIVVIDGCNYESWTNTVLYGLKFTIIYTRGEKFFLSPRIFLKFLRNISCFRTTVVASYYLSLLDVICPSVVLTFIDNSFILGTLSNFYKASYFSIQNGVRSGLTGKESKLIPVFYCFGQNEIDLYTKYKINVGKFIPVGSLKAGYYKKQLALPQEQIKYDLCLVSTFRSIVLNETDENSLYKDYRCGEILFHQFVRRYVNKRNLKCVITMAHTPFDEDVEQEELYFRELFVDQTILVNNLLEFTTYFAMDQSNLVITTYSTAALECFGWGKKTFFCNLSGDENYSFFPPNFFTMSGKSYEEFEGKMDALRSMSHDEYLSRTAKDRQYSMAYDPERPAHEVIREDIFKALSSQPPT